MTVSWDPPTTDSGEDITAYEVQFRVTGSQSWTTWQNRQPLDRTADQIIIDGLAGGTAYDVQVRASNSLGPGRWAHFVEATTHSQGGDDRTNPSPRVILQMGDRVQGHSDCTSSACHWLNIEIVGLGPGTTPWRALTTAYRQQGSRAAYTTPSTMLVTGTTTEPASSATPALRSSWS